MNTSPMPASSDAAASLTQALNVGWDSPRPKALFRSIQLTARISLHRLMLQNIETTAKTIRGQNWVQNRFLGPNQKQAQNLGPQYPLKGGIGPRSGPRFCSFCFVGSG